MTEYEVTMTVRVQCASIEDVPGFLLEAMSDHDEWPIQVRNLDDPDAPLDEIWMDKTTGLIAHGEEEE